MNKPWVIASVSLLALACSACDSKQSANEKNFTLALNNYLTTHGELCLGRHHWPVDVREDQMTANFRDGLQMPALEKAGLVSYTAIEALSPDDGKTMIKARRYDLTATGHKFFLANSGTAAHTGGDKPDLCYGRITVDKVTHWDTPDTNAKPLQTEVSYTYKINAAPWTHNPEVQKTFPIVAHVVNGGGTLVLRQQMVLTDQGWAVYTL